MKKVEINENDIEINDPAIVATLKQIAKREGITPSGLVKKILFGVAEDAEEEKQITFTVTFTRQQAAVIEDVASRLRCTPEKFIAGGFASAIEAKFLSENCNYSESIVSWLSDVLHYSDKGEDITALGEYFCIRPSVAEQEEAV